MSNSCDPPGNFDCGFAGRGEIESKTKLSLTYISPMQLTIASLRFKLSPADRIAYTGKWTWIRRRGLIIITLFLSLKTMVCQATESPWPEAVATGSGWFQLNWLGAFKTSHHGWIYHTEHGWWHAGHTASDGLWLHDASLGAWAWTSASAYPWIYFSAPISAWTLYRRDGSPSNRSFFHPVAGDWLPENRLVDWDDVLPPEGFIRVPGGTYARGDHKDETDPTMQSARPVHDITLSAFFLGRAPVTYREWRTVFDWAIDHGYAFETTGRRGAGGPAFGEIDAGIADADFHPVVAVDWYDVLKWLNAKSEMEGLEPVYYSATIQQREVFRSGQIEFSTSNWGHNWDIEATGYRLPTEAEWERAARGGELSASWPWGDHSVDPSRANYWGSTADNGTTPVGSYPANAYGFVDMAGNVAEWTWDLYRAQWYAEYAAFIFPQIHGPSLEATGRQRVIRGGSWADLPEHLWVARRGSAQAGSIGNPSIGFRIARNAAINE